MDKRLPHRIYFNPKGGRAGIWGPTVDIDHKEFPADWFEGLPEKMYLARKYDKATNKYGARHHPFFLYVKTCVRPSA